MMRTRGLGRRETERENQWRAHANCSIWGLWSLYWVERQLGGNRAFPQTHQTRKHSSSPSGTTGLGTLSGRKDTRRPGNTAERVRRMDEWHRQLLGSSRLVTGHPQVRLPRHTTCRGLKSRTLIPAWPWKDWGWNQRRKCEQHDGEGEKWWRWFKEVASHGHTDPLRSASLSCPPRIKTPQSSRLAHPPTQPAARSFVWFPALVPSTSLVPLLQALLQNRHQDQSSSNGPAPHPYALITFPFCILL